MSNLFDASRTSALTVDYFVERSAYGPQCAASKINVKVAGLESTPEITYVHKLSADVLCIVFELCEERELVQVVTTCKRWRQIAVHHSCLWRRVHASTSSPLSSGLDDSLDHPLQSVIASWRSADPSLPKIVVTRTTDLNTILSRNSPASVKLYLSLITPPSKKYAAELRVLLAKHADRLASVNILFINQDHLRLLNIHAGSSIMKGLKSLSFLYVEDPEFMCTDSDIYDEGVVDVLPLPRRGHSSLQSFQTSCLQSWMLVKPRAYERVKSLSIHVYGIDDLRAAMRACPSLETLSLHISGSLCGELLAQEDVPMGVSSVSVSGLFVDETCQQVLTVFAECAEQIIVECEFFWSGISSLFQRNKLLDFEHVPGSRLGMQTVKGTDETGFCEVSAKIAMLDTYEWQEFYRSIRLSILHIDLPVGKKIPEEYYPLVADAHAEIELPSGDDLTWHEDLLCALDASI